MICFPASCVLKDKICIALAGKEVGQKKKEERKARRIQNYFKSYILDIHKIHMYIYYYILSERGP